MKHLQPLTPAALYARVSSDRQDVDLSVSAQLRALKDSTARISFDGLNNNGKLRYSWAVDLGPFKPGW